MYYTISYTLPLSWNIPTFPHLLLFILYFQTITHRFAHNEIRLQRNSTRQPALTARSHAYLPIFKTLNPISLKLAPSRQLRVSKTSAGLRIESKIFRQSSVG